MRVQSPDQHCYWGGSAEHTFKIRKNGSGDLTSIHNKKSDPSLPQGPLIGSPWEMEKASHFVSDEDLETNYYYQGREVQRIPVVRIAEYINKVVGTRYIPPGRRGSVIMKLDVEGMEVI